jgi:hypothetical protein
LQDNDGWIRKEQAKSIIQKLNSSKLSPSTYATADVKWRTQNALYYRDIKVWLPDILLLGGTRPFCPNCKSNSRVSRHSFNSHHVAREIIGWKENYFVMTCRYICTACQEKRKEQDANATNPVNEGGTPSCPKIKYTFMGYDPKSLPLTSMGSGDEFPAFLTWRAGLDKDLIDMMRAMFDKGVRPESFSDMLLEMHSKHHVRAWLRYERAYAQEKKKEALGAFQPWDDFSSMYDEYGWNDRVPTGKYCAKAYKLFHESIRCHLNKEVKKRGAKTVSFDHSFKEAGNLCQYNGESIFNGLATGTTEVGEVRIQYHVVSGSHDQAKTPFEAFKNTTREYGLPELQLVHTDNPAADYNFFLNIFESLQRQREMFNSSLPLHNEVNPYPYDPNTPYLKIVETVGDISLAISAMVNIMNANKGFALDCEHRVVFNGRGMKTDEYKVGLIQIAYFNQNEDDRIQYLFIRTHNLKKLPPPLVSLLAGSVPVIGVNIGGDLARLGRDFGVKDDIQRRPKSSIINLGTFARKRDVVQNGSVGMKQLVKTVLGHTIDKHGEDTFSDWNAKQLTPEQIKYALIDVDAPLRMYEELSQKPDLTARLTTEDASVGKCVDVVPRYGSVACMATRAATGHIIEADYCVCPDGLSQKKVRAGAGMVTVQLDTVYSPSLEVPHYRKLHDKSKPTLGEFGIGQIVLPVQMLKDHVDSDIIREYPTNVSASNEAGTTPPAAAANPSVRQTVRLDNRSSNGVDAIDLNGDGAGESDELTGEYPTDAQIDEIMMDLTSGDIELLRASTVEGQVVDGRTPLQCQQLPEPPRLNEIEDVFSPLLGDVFHAMQRPYVPVKHEAKKGYYVALQNAFFVWNESQMEDLVSKMMKSGMSIDEIEKMKYYNSRMFINCIEREVPPPSILYWRVRAVFALYGPMKDSKTGKTLFNAKAWAKAKSILQEITRGYYSDPPGMCMYTKKLRRDGSVHKNKYGIDMIECIRGTNRTEAYHKNLVVTFSHWHTGVEMSDCLLAERRHRHNHHCAERRRFGFIRIGHFDTWYIDELQTMILKNRGYVLYPNWSNASEYKETDESFDTIAIHSVELHNALKHEWDTRIDKTAVKLTSDQKYLCKKMGTCLPFLPFSTAEEHQLFAECALRNDFPMEDPDAAAIAWCKLVDGVKIFPKLPAHIRIYKEKFERNRRVKDCILRARSGQELLHELNNALKPKVAANVEPVPFAEDMPEIDANARHNLDYVETAGRAIGVLPVNEPHRTRGSRGKDKTPRLPRPCGRCIEFGGEYLYSCKGKGRKIYCQYFAEDGTAKGSID